MNAWLSGFLLSLALTCCMINSRTCGFSVRNVLTHFTPRVRLRSFSWPDVHQQDMTAMEEEEASVESIQERKKKQIMVESFIGLVQKAVFDQTLVSLTIRGPHKKRKGSFSTKGRDDDDVNNKNNTRGLLRLINGRLISLPSKSSSLSSSNSPSSSSFRSQVQLQVTFKYHLATDQAKNWEPEQVADGLRSVLAWQPHPTAPMAASPVTLPASTNTGFWPGSTKVKKVVSEWGESFHEPGSRLGIQGATLQTLSHVIEIDLRKPHWVERQTVTEGLNQPPNNNIAQHDRIKQVPLEASAHYLQALGVTNAQGKPRPGMSSKLRQCQKFVEIVDHLVDRALATTSNAAPTRPALVENSSIDKIAVLDMGCGRGYLTFSLHAHLQAKYQGTLYKVASTGIDVRSKLVHEISEIARSLGPQFESSLFFQVGTIQDYVSDSRTNSPRIPQEAQSMEILIALHACDTATDDALWSGISRNSHVIVVAPCCHRELRAQLDLHHSASTQRADHPLSDVLRHNIYRERWAETVTDSLRALLLEWAGYEVKVFEFIGGEHTSKNVMITAVKCDTTTFQQQLAPRQGEIQKRIQALASFHGIRQQKLARFLGVPLIDQAATIRTAKRMPPM